MRKCNTISSYVIAVCAAMTFIAEANAATYYTTPSGNGSVCTQAQPCELDILNTKLKAGDVGLLAGGLYLNMQIKPVNSGEPGLPITYRISNGTVQLRRSSYLAQGAIRLDKVSYINIFGDIEIDGEATYKDSKWRYGIEFLHSHHIFIDGVKNRNILFTGLRIGENKDDTDTQWFDIKNVLVDRVCAYNMYPWDGVYNDSGYSIYN
jgi:hypothetical protein